MNLFPEIELPELICRFDNYTQSTTIIGILIYILAFIGLGFLIIKLGVFCKTYGNKN